MIRLLTLPAGLLAVLVVALVVGVSLAGLRFVRRLTTQSSLKESNDVADPVYAMIGVLYAVLLAFMVVVVWEQFTSAEFHAGLEADAIADLLREAQAFPPAQHALLQHQLLAYARDVVDREWPAMSRGEDIDLESPAFRSVWSAYIGLRLERTESTAFYTDSIARLNELSTHRKERILSAEAELPGLLWVLLIGGSVIAVVFTFLFGTANARVHYFVVTMLSALLGFVLFLIFSLEHPYIGRLSVKPTSFEHVIRANSSHP